jgi:hypothetical protein
MFSQVQGQLYIYYYYSFAVVFPDLCLYCWLDRLYRLMYHFHRLTFLLVEVSASYAILADIAYYLRQAVVNDFGVLMLGVFNEQY